MDSITNKVPNRRWLVILPAAFLSNLFLFMDRMCISMAISPGGNGSGGSVVRHSGPGMWRSGGGHSAPEAPMLKELGMSITTVGFAAGALSVGMMLMPMMGAKLAHKRLAKPFVGIVVILSAILSVLTGFIQNPTEFIALRFLLGVVEGGLTTAVLVFLTHWFPDSNGERARAISAFFAAYPLSGVVMGPLAGGLLHAYDWRVMFIVLGVITAVTGILWYILVAERPEDARWLSEQEKNYITATITEEREAVSAANEGRLVHGRKPKDKPSIFKLLMGDQRIWLLLFAIFVMCFAQAGWGLWMPSMIRNLTKVGILWVGIITIVPNAIQLVGLWAGGYFCKKVADRRIMASVPLVLLGLALIGGTFVMHSAIPGLIGICIAGLLMHAPTPAYHSLPSIIFEMRRDGPARGLIGTVNAIGSFGGAYIVSYLVDIFHGSTNIGMIASGCLLFVGAGFIMLLPRDSSQLKTKQKPKEALRAAVGS